MTEAIFGFWLFGFWYLSISECYIQLPTQAEIKTVFDKVKDFFGDAKESFGKLTALNVNATEGLEEKPEDKPKWVMKITAATWCRITTL